MPHDVEIDESRLDDTFAAIEGEYMPRGEQHYPGDDAGADPESAWECHRDLISMALFDMGVPGWEVQEHLRANFLDALIRLLDDWFPGGMGAAEEWGPLPQLLFAAGTIVLTCGVDWKARRLRPLRPEAEQEPPEEQTPEDLSGYSQAREPDDLDAASRATYKGGSFGTVGA